MPLGHKVTWVHLDLLGFLVLQEIRASPALLDHQVLPDHEGPRGLQDRPGPPDPWDKLETLGKEGHKGPKASQDLLERPGSRAGLEPPDQWALLGLPARLETLDPKALLASLVTVDPLELQGRLEGKAVLDLRVQLASLANAVKWV